MSDRTYTGTEWVEGFFLFALALWLIGALFVGTMATMGVARMGDASVSAGSNQTPVANSPQTQ